MILPIKYSHLSHMTSDFNRQKIACLMAPVPRSGSVPMLCLWPCLAMFTGAEHADFSDYLGESRKWKKPLILKL